MKAYAQLTKQAIVIFVLLGGLVGFAVGSPIGQPMLFEKALLLALGLYLLSSGSFALNQAQEWKQDAKMPRTQGRPIPGGVISPVQAYLLGITFSVFGLGALYLLSPLTALTGLFTLFLYNVAYTMFWKAKWAFGAVPGAIPGAMPIIIGYSVNNPNIFSPEAMYLFIVMILWQMPHFWTIALRYKEDYRKGGFPVLPTKLGDERTFYHIGLYTFVYVAVALLLPLFFKANFLYLLLLVPIAAKIMIEFFRFFNHRTNWLPFFLWVNFSLLIFLMVPVFDKWLFYWVSL